MKTWHAHAFVIVTAIALYYLKWPLLILAAIWLLIRLCRRHPMLAWFTLAFIRGLLSGLFGRHWPGRW
jgi:hypothetical protein